MTLLEIDQYKEDIKLIYEQNLPWNMLFGKAILLTGATGMIGSCVGDYLLWLNQTEKLKADIIFAGRDRERVRSRFEPFQEGKDYAFAPFDAVSGEPPLTDKKKIDFIIHAASNAHPEAYAKQPVETMLANLLGTNALLDLAVKRAAKRVLFISSSEVYGIWEEERPFLETDYGYMDLLSARSCYPSSKRGAETLCAAYTGEYGIETVIVRPGHVYGPTMTDQDSRAAAQFARNARDGKNIVMKSTGTQRRSYCYVTDCVAALFTVLLKGETGNAYNISSEGSTCYLRSFAEAFAKAGGGNVQYAAPSSGELKGYNRMYNSSLNARKLEALGWRAQISLMDGVRKTVEELREIETLRR